MSRALASLAALMLAAASASAQWTPGLWPTTNVFRFAADAQVTVTGISVLVFAETTTTTTSSGPVTHALSYFRDLDAQPWAGTAEGFERTTNVYAGATAITFRTWSTNAPPLKLQAREMAAWDCWRAMVERDQAAPAGLFGTTSAPPRFYRVARSNLVVQKEWVAARAASFVIQANFTNYFSGGGTTESWPPKWTAAGLLASNGLPADYLTNTPWRALIGEGTNQYGYNGLRACLSNLVWTSAAPIWTNGVQRERAGYSFAEDYDGLIGAYTNWADAVFDTPPATVATNGDLTAPQRNTSGSMADFLPFAYSAASAWWKARADAATGLVCHADLYCRAAPGGRFGGTMVWDALGDEWTSGVAVATNPTPAAVIVKAAASNMVISGSVPMNTDPFEGTPPFEPDGGNPVRSRGWVLDWSQIILRWDVEGGFKYR